MLLQNELPKPSSLTQHSLMIFSICGAGVWEQLIQVLSHGLSTTALKGQRGPQSHRRLSWPRVPSKLERLAVDRIPSLVGCRTEGLSSSQCFLGAALGSLPRGGLHKAAHKVEPGFPQCEQEERVGGGVGRRKPWFLVSLSQKYHPVTLAHFIH